MEAESIQTQGRLETYYWWFLGRRKVIEEILETKFSGKKIQILDWGCGAGGNFVLLSRFGSVLGVDTSDEALRLSKEKGIINLVKAGNLEEFQDSPSLPPPLADQREGRGELSKFDLVSAFDVLEHVPDDEAFLRGFHQLLKPGGYVLLTVPAYQFLWSELDDLVGHIRRYTRKGLETKLENAGFETVRSSYFVTILFLPILLYRFLGKLTGRSKNPKFSYVEFPKIINWLFTKLLTMEAKLLKFFSLPFGTSIIVLAKKK